MSDSDTEVVDPHVAAWEVRQTDPAFSDGTVASPGTEFPPEPGPGPEEEEGEDGDSEDAASEDDEEDELEEGFDPADYSVDEVLKYVRDNPEYTEQVAALEAEGKGRKGILDHVG